ncbi:MAG: NAD(P)H-hydrate epimerase [Anaerolineaceae bacterium]|nr:NAD(P)H-hydrate epimerase [Anaerolineaceae bacterium]
MITVSVEKMRKADQYTIAMGTPSRELMRRAANGVFEAYPGWVDAKTLIVCGSGNNGGDGYALASIMKDKDLDVTILRVSEKFSEDGAYYYERCQEKGVPVLMYGTDSVDFESYQIIVDCMLGTGFSGTPRGPVAAVIGEINNARELSDTYVISVDINSGMNGDTGEAENAVVSDLTVSIGYYKNGFFQGKAAELIGSLTNADIGIILPKD